MHNDGGHFFRDGGRKLHSVKGGNKSLLLLHGNMEDTIPVKADVNFHSVKGGRKLSFSSMATWGTLFP